MAELLSLADHLRTASRPFAWGACDCCTWACDWVLARRGVDPASRWRGRYKTARGAMRQIRKGGDFASVVAVAMEASGLVETTTPAPGDIGVVSTAQGLALALRTPRGWACKSESGVVVADFMCLRSWTV